MVPVTFVSDLGESRCTGTVIGDHLLVGIAPLQAASGWRFKGMTLIDGSSSIDVGPGPLDRADHGLTDLTSLAESPDVPLAIGRCGDEWVVAMGRSAPEVARRLCAGEASDVVLSDLDGRPRKLFEVAAGRTVVIALSSWCACHLDLPVWEERARQLASSSVSFAVVAVENDLEHARAWANRTTLPILVDLDRYFCEYFGVVTVPTVLWLDEQHRIVRPNDQVFADNRLTEHHGLDCWPHHHALSEWAGTGRVPDECPPPMPPTPGEQKARCEYRVATRLWRHGSEDLARRHLDRAAHLGPEDLTIRRAAIQLFAGDPLGEDFAPLYREWMERTAGRAYRSR